MKRVYRPLEKYEVSASGGWDSDVTLCFKEIGNEELEKLVDFLKEMGWCE